MSYQMLRAVGEFCAKLDAGQVCVGAGITFDDPLVTDALADSVDFFWIDTEHALITPQALAGHLLAARAHGVPGLVRPPGSDSAFIKPVLDTGAGGIIVPQVRSAEEVRRIVSDCRYAPIGHRGYGPRVPSNYGRSGGDDYITYANEELFVSVQIENAEALGAIEEIAAVPGLDSLVLGPSDLAASLGHMNQLEHPDVLTAIDRIVHTAQAAGLYIGSGMGADPDYACLMANRGIQWLQVGCDYSYLVAHMDQIGSQIQSCLARGQATDASTTHPE